MKVKIKTFFTLIAAIFLFSTDQVFANGSKDMVKISGGTFWMGSDAGNQAMPHGGVNNESPVHEVKLDGFWIDKHPVTNEQYAKFVKATGYATYSEQTPKAEDWPGALPEMLVPASIVFKKPTTKVNMNNLYNWWEYKPGASWLHPEGPQSNIKKRADHPVVHVTYDDAAAYCTWAGKEMLMEAQWEYAARGGLTKKVYTWGCLVHGGQGYVLWEPRQDFFWDLLHNSEDDTSRKPTPRHYQPCHKAHNHLAENFPQGKL